MLAPSDLRTIARLLRKKVPMQAIADRFGVTRQRISQIAKELVPEQHQTRPPVHPPEFLTRAEKLWDQGLSASEVAARMGVEKNVISGISWRNGFTPRPSPIRRSA
jgi:hypothetical protein